MNGVGNSASARRWTALALLGFASGLPLALSGDLLTAWLSDCGFNPEKIGLLGLVGLPYAFKVIWSPLADRFTPPFLGRRRGWIIVIQLLLIVAILAMAMTDPRRAILPVAIAAAAVAFLSATQDIVSDAWRADVLSGDDRGPGAAISVAAYRIGMLATGAGALILVGRFHIGWPAACRLTALAMIAGIIGTLIAPEAKGDHVSRPANLREAVAKPLLSLLKRPGGWTILLFILLFKLPEYLANGMSLPFLLNLGFHQEQIGELRQGLGTGLTILGAILGGGVVKRLGIWKSLWLFGVLHSVSNLAFLALAQIGPNNGALLAVIAVENICVGLTTAGLIAWMIGQCDVAHSAFQFALLSGVMALGRVLALPLGGWMAHEFGWPRFFIASALGGLPGLVLLARLNGGAMNKGVTLPPLQEALPG